MLALLLAWLLLALLALPLGWLLLARFDASGSVARTGDRACAAIWLGTAAAAALLAALSLCAALGAIASLLVWIAALALCWLQPGVRREARALRDALRADQTLTGLAALAALAVAAHATHTVTNYDPGLYHYQHIQWLSDHGVVRGMGLIHSRFSFAGDWFALPAALNHGPLRARVATVSGGLVVLLATLQWLLCLQRCRQSRALNADRYLLVAFGLMLLYVIDKGWFNATSPDAPVFVLTILIGWLLLLTPRGGNALPLLLALAALGCKLSALPLLPVAAWHARWPLCRRAAWVAGPLGAVLAAQSFIGSGCLAYPLASSCFAVDWGLGADAAAREAAAVLQWARWSALPAAGDAVHGGTGWLQSWVPAHDVEIALFALALLALAWRCARLLKVPGASLVAALALFNIGLGMLSAPDARFWGGCLFALLGLAGIGWWPAGSAPAPAAAPTPAVATRGPWLTLGLVTLFIVLTLAGLARKPLTALLRPPAMQSPALTLTSTATGLAYWLPASGNQCWAAPLPCAPARLPEAIGYRDAAAGAASGFTQRRSP
jgi:hypothetical protein